MVLLIASCASFPASANSFTAAPSLTPAVVTPVDPTPAGPGVTSSTTSASRTPTSAPKSTPATSGTSSATRPSPTTARSTPSSTATSAPADPCTPTDAAVIAACLSAPWGLIPLADGESAIVGERTTGRILQVAYGQKPVVLTTISGLDSSGDGGLLGLALSPTYDEDGLIFAYVTTKTDNRILRIAAGDRPKAIFTGIPKGKEHNGGPIEFVGNDLLVGTGNTGRPSLASSATSLAGKILRMDVFGHPVGGTLDPGSAVYASGLTQPTGLCDLPTGALGVVDHRSGADLLLSVQAGKSYAAPTSSDTAWTWTAASGGGNDCAYDNGILVDTSLTGQRLTAVAMGNDGSYSGQPSQLLGNTYGRLLTVETGPQHLFWMTTSNKDGHGKPVPSDDRVIVLKNNGGAGGGID